MIEQITTIILAFAFGSLTSLFAFALKRYLTMGWRAIKQEK